MTTPKFNESECRALFAHLDQIHIVCIHPNGLKIVGKEFGQYVDNAVGYAEAQNNAGLNVYWSVNRVRDNLDKKASKADVVAARFIHVDIDPPKTGGAFDKGAIIEGLQSLDHPPKPLVDESVVFEESNGTIAIEAEHYYKQSVNSVRSWYINSPLHRPNTQPDYDEC